MLNTMIKEQIISTRRPFTVVLSTINARFEFTRFSFLNVAMILYVASIPVNFLIHGE